MKITMHRNSLLSVLCAFALALVSCGPVKDISYFQNKVVDKPELIDKHAGIVVQPNDKLSIVVSSRNPELVAMFNRPTVSYSIGDETSAGLSRSGMLGYIVDTDGYIEFPVLGLIKVSGLTRWEVSELIKRRLLDDGLLTDALVAVEFMNFKVSVLGEVNAPGTYNLDGDKTTILQALSVAGDLTIFGMRENVTVIRELNGKRTMYEINLCDVSLFNSPAYHLQQNDVIYVQPSEIKAREATTDERAFRVTSIAISSTSILISLASLLLGIFAN